MKKTILNNFDAADLKIYKEEFFDFLPKNIFDIHVHLWKKKFISSEISKNRKNQNPFLDPDILVGFTIEDFQTAMSTVLPDKEVEGLYFALPVKEANLQQSNEYIAEICKKNNSYGLYVPEPKQGLIPDDFFKNRFIGFKPYPDLVEFEEPKSFSELDIDISNFDFISKTVLEFSNEYGLILLIHIPRKGRLNDKRNISELETIANKYKNIKIILAHAGRSYCYEDIKESINFIKRIKNLYVDTAMINNFSVNKILIKELGPERILFGSDSVISLLKGKNIEINNKHFFVTKYPKNWSLSSKKMNLDFTLFLYEIIRSVKLAAEELKLSKKDIEKIFYYNSRNMINEIVSKI